MPTIDKRAFLLGSFTTMASLGLVDTRSASAGPKTDLSAPTLDLMNPPGARTADSIAELWAKIIDREVEGYEVYLDGKLITTTKYTDHT